MYGRAGLPASGWSAIDPTLPSTVRRCGGRRRRPPRNPYCSLLLEELTDGARGLSQAVIVFDQREAHKALAQRAEPNPGGNSHLSLLQQELAKFQRAEAPIALRDGSPQEHGALR